MKGLFIVFLTLVSLNSYSACKNEIKAVSDTARAFGYAAGASDTTEKLQGEANNELVALAEAGKFQATLALEVLKKCINEKVK